jgi:hypothetical protein
MGKWKRRCKVYIEVLISPLIARLPPTPLSEGGFGQQEWPSLADQMRLSLYRKVLLDIHYAHGNLNRNRGMKDFLMGREAERVIDFK